MTKTLTTTLKNVGICLNENCVGILGGLALGTLDSLGELDNFQRYANLGIVTVASTAQRADSPRIVKEKCNDGLANLETLPLLAVSYGFARGVTEIVKRYAL